LEADKQFLKDARDLDKVHRKKKKKKKKHLKKKLTLVRTTGQQGRFFNVVSHCVFDSRSQFRISSIAQRRRGKWL
jgi:hypothetical protein